MLLTSGPSLQTAVTRFLRNIFRRLENIRPLENMCTFQRGRESTYKVSKATDFRGKERGQGPRGRKQPTFIYDEKNLRLPVSGLRRSSDM